MFWKLDPAPFDPLDDARAGHAFLVVSSRVGPAGGRKSGATSRHRLTPEVSSRGVSTAALTDSSALREIEPLVAAIGGDSWRGRLDSSPKLLPLICGGTASCVLKRTSSLFGQGVVLVLTLLSSLFGQAEAELTVATLTSFLFGQAAVPPDLCGHAVFRAPESAGIEEEEFLERLSEEIC